MTPTYILPSGEDPAENGWNSRFAGFRIAVIQGMSGRNLCLFICKYLNMMEYPEGM